MSSKYYLKIKHLSVFNEWHRFFCCVHFFGIGKLNDCPIRCQKNFVSLLS